MILVDPDLEPSAAADSPVSRAAKRAVAPDAPDKPRSLSLPSARTLARFLAAAQAAMRLHGEVAVLLTTDAAIRKLNRRFRGKNQPTDVLSFPAEGPDGGPLSEGIAGDLAIGVTTALGQAREQGHSLSTEIKVLILHGLLHLAGYDHETDTGQMARRERRLRTRLGLPNGLIERAFEPKTPAMKGHGFSRAAEKPKRRTALAPAGMRENKENVPPGLTREGFSGSRSARLKSSPFKAAAKASRP